MLGLVHHRLDGAGNMSSNLSPLFWLEAALAAACGILALVTLITRDWIEALTGFDPDQHNGSVEWAIVVALALACVLLAFAARAEFRRAAVQS
jgi:hypothetical protein